MVSQPMQLQYSPTFKDFSAAQALHAKRASYLASCVFSDTIFSRSSALSCWFWFSPLRGRPTFCGRI